MRDLIIDLIKNAIDEAKKKGVIPEVVVEDIELERPRRREHGDLATNIALLVASKTGKSPREVAGAIVGFMDKESRLLTDIEVAGPGFINFRFSPRFTRSVLFEIQRKGADFGRSSVGKNRRVQIEFVSANPVGPLHVGHGRWAAFGDALANVMSHAGYRVEREFYINDYGSQMKKFGRSIYARYMELLGKDVVFPADGYAGEYIREIAKRILSERGESFAGLDEKELVEKIIEMEYPVMLESIKKTLNRMGVSFDVWFSERELYLRGEVEKTLKLLEDKGEAYWRDGALWLRTTTYGDEKDRVLIRSNGEPTYFASDIAYHRDKMERGFDLVINIWGADHHGYVPRMKAAMQAMGYDPSRLEVILGQLVKLYRGGEPVTMSKRTGEIITLDELLDEVGVDASRYFFLQRSSDSHLDFDIDLAKKESPENPVFYVQYAHARISSILRYAKEIGADDSTPTEDDLDLLREEVEIDLIKKLGELEEVVEFCAEKRAPHRLTGYAEDLASLFHGFYRDCRVITDDAALTRARIFAVKGVRQVIRIVLGMLGVSAPDEM